MKTTKGGKWVSMEDYKKLEAEKEGLYQYNQELIWKLCVKEKENAELKSRWERLKEETKRYGGIVFYSNEILNFTKVVTIRALQKKMHELEKEKGDGKG